MSRGTIVVDLGILCEVVIGREPICRGGKHLAVAFAHGRPRDSKRVVISSPVATRPRGDARKDLLTESCRRALPGLVEKGTKAGVGTAPFRHHVICRPEPGGGERSQR